jgi:hypothetical protein
MRDIAIYAVNYQSNFVFETKKNSVKLKTVCIHAVTNQPKQIIFVRLLYKLFMITKTINSFWGLR